MRPFPIEPFDELFKDGYQPREKWPAGAFDYQMIFYTKLTKQQEYTIAEWLSYNCKDNFIFAKDERETIAGGFTDNLSRWKKHKRNRQSVITEYCIRLYQNDIWFFKMVWTN